MRLVPVKLHISNRTILDSYRSVALSFPPECPAETFLQRGELSNAMSARNRLDPVDQPKNLE
ncbi:MAG: hypothetical protein QOC81_4197 [Thermoanaerobaculia bacterium]|nr:hypothetical protein [Thermoanaerobaculia bacterium]